MFGPQAGGDMSRSICRMRLPTPSSGLSTRARRPEAARMITSATPTEFPLRAPQSAPDQTYNPASRSRRRAHASGSGSGQPQGCNSITTARKEVSRSRGSWRIGQPPPSMSIFTRSAAARSRKTSRAGTRTVPAPPSVLTRPSVARPVVNDTSSSRVKAAASMILQRAPDGSAARLRSKMARFDATGSYAVTDPW